MALPCGIDRRAGPNSTEGRRSVHRSPTYGPLPTRSGSRQGPPVRSRRPRCRHPGLIHGRGRNDDPSRAGQPGRGPAPSAHPTMSVVRRLSAMIGALCSSGVGRRTDRRDDVSGQRPMATSRRRRSGHGDDPHLASLAQRSALFGVALAAMVPIAAELVRPPRGLDSCIPSTATSMVQRESAVRLPSMQRNARWLTSMVWSTRPRRSRDQSSP